MVLPDLPRAAQASFDTLATSALHTAVIPRLADVNALRPTPDATACTWTTPDNSGVVVHPSVRFFPEGFPEGGPAWWAVATPYTNTNNQVENPCLYVSVDGTHWTDAPGVTNPLVPTPPGGAYNSDPCLVPGPDGTLHIVYRTSTGNEDRFSVISSADGETWTTPAVILTSDASLVMPASPAVWYDVLTQEWVMLAVDLIARTIRRYTADAISGPWTFDQLVTVSPAWPTGYGPWHLDALPLGDQVLALVHDNALTDAGWQGALWLMTSTDAGRSFTRATRPLRGSGAYKGALLPRLSERGLELDVWAGLARAEWGVERFRAMRPAPTLELALELGLGAARISPYLASDRFDRANSTTGLGFADSGQEWYAELGTIGILNGWAVPPAAADGNNNIATLDTGTGDVEISVTMDTSGGSAGRECWLGVRMLDAGNFIRGGMIDGEWVVERVENFGVTELGRAGQVPDAPDHRVALRAVGNQVSLWLNGERIVVATESFNAADTRVALQQINTVTRITDVLVRTW